jgi:putrescine transport system substrate-binding protein
VLATPPWPSARERNTGRSGTTASSGLRGDAKPGGSLFIYNWSDYIAEDTIAQFEAETGIKVTYDVFDSNEVLEAKLLAGSTGYDLVVPSLSFLGRQIVAGASSPSTARSCRTTATSTPKLMARIAETDPDNKLSVPYLWGTTGIGYNVGKIAEIFGEDFEVDSWSLVLDPANASKLAGAA